ncbi:carbon starvation CstA family protein [Thermococcus thioreducens]|uniref:Carbon starvation protein n=1 Tax=Thermococcus thioreducens TaxID=277988 RepID=A0A0Q2RE22_9EURY|nr:carbon starvation protein A [Thermococcus thioreducens]ASJ12743.1 carbon starvation protein CstA [Thermococcus thioreducens]KQH82214.1 carbon starvation protein CstA [Thermococcus thioreducens]SEV85912.1 carbon starvation protein [Thermococcus thioreducens]
MNSAVIILIAAAIYLGMYFTYGKSLQNKVVRADSGRPTPAHKLYDGVDYVPAHPLVLYGHHFASIAGAGPIVGPALAMAWGWLPGLIWVWFGNVFIGAVHDYLALMSSVRYDGKSVQWIAGKLMTRRTGIAFEFYILFALLLVIAAFMSVIAGIFTKTPEAATASILFLISAVIVGYLMYKTSLHFAGATIVGLILLVVSVWLGFKYPIQASYHQWNIFLFVYIIIAASLPVWVLLQPRDYLNAYILWFGLILGGVAFAILGSKGTFTAPAYTSWSASVVGGKPSPFWPTIPLVIACGSLSGFHSIVGSGTTSKQLDNELHGLMVGYGGMFTEGFLSTIVIASIAVYGIKVFADAGIDINAANWASIYAPKVAGEIGKVGIFAKSYAYGLQDAFGIPFKTGAVFASLWVSAFALTTLDTATRLGRFAWQEVVGMLMDTSEGIGKAISNKWLASFVLALVGMWLAWGNQWLILWPAFSGMNQMLASIAMMTGALWVTKVQQAGKWSYAVLIPAVFLWITVSAALVWFLAVVVPGIGDVGTRYAVGFITLVGILLNLMLVFDFYAAWKKPSEEYAAAS